MGVALRALEDDPAVVIPTTEYLIQRLSNRSLLLLEMGPFTAGTLICAAASGLELLLTGRIAQATGTAS